ncbi:MerR family transcriptional regulator [Virgibacillus siamensis]|uniref:MerR family transcriptional regulator n=1 Tax=Virgibacillus siamensis TaxID=480071 RepID=A0ABN1FUZ9_9BACI
MTYSIGKLAEMSRVSVRTLRYYNEIGILQPAEISTGGHRYYDSDSIIKLQYILTLKEIGFNLDRIKEITLKNNQSVQELLQIRLNAVREEKRNLEYMEQKIKAYIQLVDLSGKEYSEDIFSTFRHFATKNNTVQQNRDQYFSKEEQQLLAQLPNFADDNDLIKQWQSLFQEIRSERTKGNPAETQIGLQLAEKWSDLVKEMYSGNMELAQKTWEIQREKADIGLVQFDSEVTEYIENAFKYAEKLRDTAYD